MKSIARSGLALLALPLLALLFASTASAHRAWIVPAATVLSAEDAWVTFDAAVSNDIFHADYVALRADGMTVASPDGSAVEVHNLHSGKHRTTFDLNLQVSGTYRVFMASNGLTARWESESGERRMWPARGATPNPQGFKKEVPNKAKNLQVTQSSRRMETFVTAGAPTNTVLKPSNVGLELVPLTHPNDLFMGEKAQFRFLIDGKPAVGAEVSVIPAGMRYRNDQAEIKLVTDNKGFVEVEWPQAGMFWLNATYQDNRATKPATQRRGNYTAVLEVLPQ